MTTRKICTADDVDAYDELGFYPSGDQRTIHVAQCYNCAWHDETFSELGDAEAAAHHHWWRTYLHRHAEDVLDAVRDERDRQHEKWGEQNHPDGTGPKTTPVAEIVRGPANAIVNRHYAFGLANQAKAATDHAAAEGRLTYCDIFLEEVFEALAEDDPDKLEAELIQVAAVAVAWVEKIRRHREQAPEGRPR